MMPRYIDAEEAIHLIEIDALLMFGYTKRDAIDCIKATPTADVQEVRHGKWISEIVKIPDWRGKEQSYYQPNSCSICHTGLRIRTNFCPNCGAKMDGEE